MGDATRRQVLGAAGAMLCALAAGPSAASAQSAGEFAAALKKALGDAQPQHGKVVIGAPDIADNGATVAVTFSVESPMTPAAYVKRITVLADGNPNPEVAVFNFTPRSGKAEVATRIRLAKTQNVVAVAVLSDNSLWLARKEIKVTIGGCGG
jgi:sulfur-oxidizing protein SoxY